MTFKNQLQEALAQFKANIKETGLPPTFSERLEPGTTHYLDASKKMAFNASVYVFTGTRKSHLDNWSRCNITINTTSFGTSEQAIFAACKAALFGDTATFNKATATPTMHAREAKALGRCVTNFNDDVWMQAVPWIHDTCVLMKCIQNAPAMLELLSTRGMTIGEASSDLRWGIGVHADDIEIALDPTKWTGKNELGNSLMRVREFLLRYIQSDTPDDQEKEEWIMDKERIRQFYAWFE